MDDIDILDSKRVFILGPSHHVYLESCALSQCDSYETPLGDLVLDKEGMDASTGCVSDEEDSHVYSSFSHTRTCWYRPLFSNVQECG